MRTSHQCSLSPAGLHSALGALPHAGQCYSDLDGSIALSHNGSMDTGPLVDPHKHAEAPSSAQSSVGDNPVADLAVLMEIERGPRAHSVPAKLKPARDTGAAAPRCSNKMLRSINSLCQPRK